MTNSQNMTQPQIDDDTSARSLGAKAGNLVLPRQGSAIIEDAGARRKDVGQTLEDRLREIRGEEGWIDAADLGGFV